MLIREHTENGTISKVAYSKCRDYRYWLTRRWGDGPTVNFIMLNPSKADEHRNDPTVERCEKRARKAGFSAFCVTNVFAWRDTDPREMRRSKEPVGPGNDSTLIEKAHTAKLVVAAWGVHGAHLDRGPAVKALLQDAGVSLHHLGLTRHGHPRHPLYLPYSAQTNLWR